MEKRLNGKVAIITGGSRGQGAAEAELFAREGALVAIADILVDEGNAQVEKINRDSGKAMFCKLDVSSEQGWADVVAAVENRFGPISVLINNAGINLRYSITEMVLEDWERLLAVNLTGPMLGIRSVVPSMKKAGSGSIVNVGSTAGMVGHPTTAYSAAKWGLRGLTKSAALDLVKWKIRVNAMHPGLVDTPIISKESKFYKELIAMTPMERSGQSIELANVALFLASDESSFVTGIDVPVDGGLAEFATYWRLWNDAKKD